MMEKVYSRPAGIFEGAVTGFCPGCMHSSVCKIVCEALEELGQLDNACYVQGVGCCGLAVTYFDMDTVAAPHGRACAIASSFKRCSPETLVFTYQGDGDLAAIGLAETMSAANRGENFTVIFVNNGIYGMTGGQMAPTTLVGMKATTCPNGRNPQTEGYPMHMAEMIAQLKRPVFSGRFAVDTPANILKTKKAIQKAFQNQLDGKGFSMVEVLSNCPTNWGLAPLKTLDFIHEQTMGEFPLGVFKDI